MSLFSRRLLLCSAPQPSFVASTLVQHGCPHQTFVTPRSRFRLCGRREFVVSTLSLDRFPGRSSGSCARPSARLPEREPVRHRSSSSSFLVEKGLRVSVSRIHEARFASGLPMTKRAPHMVPEAMKSPPIHARRRSAANRSRTARFGHAILERSTTSRLPARSRDCHCTSRSCVEADLVAPVARSSELDRVPRVACAMKPSSPLQFPETTTTTSLHGASVRLPRCAAQFPKPIIDADARCSSNPAYAPPGFPNESSTAKRFPGGGLSLLRPVSRAEQRHPTAQAARARRARLAAPVARLGGAHSPARVARAHDAGDLRPVSRAQSPASLRAVRA
jgi:hypothetical protein